MQNIRFRGLALAATGAVAVFATGSASAQNVSVTLNGSPVSLVPAPISRAGRVFVPLRGVFEKLGASVVYAGGTINAQSNGRSVALRIGSTQATVDGQAQMLDVAPFIVGASTYVPLRFVSQALGATVNYDGSNHVVALTRDGGAANMPATTLTPQPAAAQAGKSALTLSAVRPGRNASVESRRPTVEAQFSGAQADPNSIKISLDNLDITNSASRSPSGIVYSPPSALQSGPHTVRVMGHDSEGMAFDRSWRFTSGTSSVTNVIDEVKPTEGATVPSQFTVSGHTVANARVVIQVGAVQQQTAQNVIGQILGIGGGGNPGSTFRSEVSADGNGMFSAGVTVNAQSGQQLVLVIDSTEPSSQTAAPRQTRQLVVQ